MRGKQAPKRKIKPDVKYHRLDIAKLINYVMRAGKKSASEKIVYGSLDYIAQKTKDDPFIVYELAMRNIGPSLEVRGRRVGGELDHRDGRVADDVALAGREEVHHRAGRRAQRHHFRRGAGGIHEVQARPLRLGRRREH